MKKTFNYKQFARETNKTTKRFALVFFVSLLTFLATCFTGVFPSVYAYMKPAMAHKEIKGAFYSMKPSKYDNKAGDSITIGGKTKYYYTLVDEGTSDPKYQYYLEENNEVYLFEYYAYLDQKIETNEKTKIAVYSKSDLVYDPNTKLYKSSKGSKNDQLYYKTVTDYLFYGIKKFNPEWAEQSTPLYGGEGGDYTDREHSYDKYYAYEFYDNKDLDYQSFEEVDVINQYKFDLGNLGVKYDNANYIDNGAFEIHNSGNSETQIISPNSDDQLGVFVLQRIGNSYTTQDVYGREIGHAKGESYYKGGQFYFYNPQIKGDNSQIINGFEIYSIDKEKTETLVVNPGSGLETSKNKEYTIFTFDKNSPKKELLVEAVRYYDTFDISYELVDKVISENLTDVNENELISNNVNVEFVGTEFGGKYKLMYQYTFDYNGNYKYTVTYKENKVRYVQSKHQKEADVIFELKEVDNHVEQPTGFPITQFEDKVNEAVSANNDTIFISDLQSYRFYEQNKDLAVDVYSYAPTKVVSNDVTATQGYYEVSNQGGSVSYKSNSLPDSSLLSYPGASSTDLTLVDKSIPYYEYDGVKYANREYTINNDIKTQLYNVYQVSVNTAYDSTRSNSTNSATKPNVDVTRSNSYTSYTGNYSRRTDYKNTAFVQVWIQANGTNGQTHKNDKSLLDLDKGGANTLADISNSINEVIDRMMNYVRYGSTGNRSLTVTGPNDGKQVSGTIKQYGSNGCKVEFKTGHGFWAMDAWSKYTIYLTMNYPNGYTGPTANSEAKVNGRSISSIPRYSRRTWDNGNNTSSPTFEYLTGYSDATSTIYFNYYNKINIYNNGIAARDLTKEEIITRFDHFLTASELNNKLNAYQNGTTFSGYYYYVEKSSVQTTEPSARYNITLSNKIALTHCTREINNLVNYQFTLSPYNSGSKALTPEEWISKKNDFMTQITSSISVMQDSSSGKTLRGLTFKENLNAKNDIKRAISLDPNVTTITFEEVKLGEILFETASSGSYNKTTNILEVKTPRTSQIITKTGATGRVNYKIYSVTTKGGKFTNPEIITEVSSNSPTINSPTTAKSVSLNGKTAIVSVKRTYYTANRVEAQVTPNIVKGGSNTDTISKYENSLLESNWTSSNGSKLTIPRYTRVGVTENTVQKVRHTIVYDSPVVVNNSYSSLDDAWNKNKPDIATLEKLIIQELKGLEYNRDFIEGGIQAVLNSVKKVESGTYRLMNTTKKTHTFEVVATRSNVATSNSANLYYPNGQLKTDIVYKAGEGDGLYKDRINFNDLSVKSESSVGRLESKNFFDEFNFFKAFAQKNKFLRITKEANYFVYETKEPVVINNIPTGYYVSYYHNGNLVKNGQATSNTLTINPGKISRIMVSRTNAAYTPYTGYTLATGTNSSYKHTVSYNHMVASKRIYQENNVIIGSTITSGFDKIIGNAVYSKNKSGNWEIKFPNINYDNAGVKQSVDLGKIFEGQTSVEFNNSIQNYGDVNHPFTIKSEIFNDNGVQAQGFLKRVNNTNYNVFFEAHKETQVIKKATNKYLNTSISNQNGNVGEYSSNNEIGVKAITFFNAFIPTYAKDISHPNANHIEVKLNLAYAGKYIDMTESPEAKILGQIQSISNYNGGLSNDYYVIKEQGEYKLTKVGNKIFKKYRVYKDKNKTLSSNGRDFTYNDEGYTEEITNIEEIINAGLTGINVNTSTGVYTPPKLSVENVFTNVNVKNGLISVDENIVGRKPISSTDYNDVNPNNYNKYQKNELVGNQIITVPTEKTGGKQAQFLYLAELSVRRNYPNIYKDNNNGMYKLVFDDERYFNSTIEDLINSTLSYPYKNNTNQLLDTFTMTGQWTKTNFDEAVKNSNYFEQVQMSGLNVPFFIDPNNIYCYTGAKHSGDLNGKGMYIYKVLNDSTKGTIPAHLKGKWLVQNPILTLDNKHGLIYTNEVNGENYQKSIDSKFNDYIIKNSVIEINGKQLTKFFHMTTKVDTYKLLEKKEYAPNYIYESNNTLTYNKNLIDLRTQFAKGQDITHFFENVSNNIIPFYGDDMQTTVSYKLAMPDLEGFYNDVFKFNSSFENTPMEYLFEPIRIYNGFATDNPATGGIRPGVIYYDKKTKNIKLNSSLGFEPIAEKIFYKGKVYHLGNIIDKNVNPNDFNNYLVGETIYEKLAKELEIEINKIILECINDLKVRNNEVNDMSYMISYALFLEKMERLDIVYSSDAFDIRVNLDSAISKQDVEKGYNHRNEKIVDVSVNKKLTGQFKGDKYIVLGDKIYYEYANATEYTSNMGARLKNENDTFMPYKISKPTHNELQLGGYYDTEINKEKFTMEKANNVHMEQNKSYDPFVEWILINEDYNKELSENYGNTEIVSKALKKDDKVKVYNPAYYVPLKSNETDINKPINNAEAEYKNLPAQYINDFAESQNRKFSVYKTLTPLSDYENSIAKINLGDFVENGQSNYYFAEVDDSLLTHLKYYSVYLAEVDEFEYQNRAEQAHLFGSIHMMPFISGTTNVLASHNFEVKTKEFDILKESLTNSNFVYYQDTQNNFPYTRTSAYINTHIGGWYIHSDAHILEANLLHRNVNGDETKKFMLVENMEISRIEMIKKISPKEGSGILINAYVGTVGVPNGEHSESGKAYYNNSIVVGNKRYTDYFDTFKREANKRYALNEAISDKGNITVNSVTDAYNQNCNNKEKLNSELSDLRVYKGASFHITEHAIYSDLVNINGHGEAGVVINHGALNENPTLTITPPKTEVYSSVLGYDLSYPKYIVDGSGKSIENPKYPGYVYNPNDEHYHFEDRNATFHKDGYNQIAWTGYDSVNPGYTLVQFEAYEMDTGLYDKNTYRDTLINMATGELGKRNAIGLIESAFENSTLAWLSTENSPFLGYMVSYTKVSLEEAKNYLTYDEWLDSVIHERDINWITDTACGPNSEFKSQKTIKFLIKNSELTPYTLELQPKIPYKLTFAEFERFSTDVIGKKEIAFDINKGNNGDYVEKLENGSIVPTNKLRPFLNDNIEVITRDGVFANELYFVSPAIYTKNPYVEFKHRPVETSDGRILNGDSLLYNSSLNNELIDRDIVNYLFGATSQEHNLKGEAKETYRFVNKSVDFNGSTKKDLIISSIDDSGNIYSKGSSIMKEGLKDQNTLEFSANLLAQRYDDNENIIGVAFIVTKSGENTPYYPSGKTIDSIKAYSKTRNSEVTLNAIAGYKGTYLYRLSAAEIMEFNRTEGGKRVYKTLDDFVAEYLLKDNLEFRFVDYFSEEDTNLTFNIKYQAHYDLNNIYFDYNQNGKYDGNNKLVVNGESKFGYNINGDLVVNEASNFMSVQDFNKIYGEGKAEFNEVTPNWKLGTFRVREHTGTDLRITAVVNGKTVSLRLFTNGESHIVK